MAKNTRDRKHAYEVRPIDGQPSYVQLEFTEFIHVSCCHEQPRVYRIWCNDCLKHYNVPVERDYNCPKDPNHTTGVIDHESSEGEAQHG